MLALDLKILSHLFSLIQHTIESSERGGNKMRDVLRNLKRTNPTCASVLETVVRVLSIPQVQSALGPEWPGAQTGSSNFPKPQAGAALGALGCGTPLCDPDRPPSSQLPTGLPGSSCLEGNRILSVHQPRNLSCNQPVRSLGST